jgi:hypothetical protein
MSGRTSSVVKLAVAALAVAGVVGTVWAGVSVMDKGAATITEGGDNAASMKMTYTIEQTAVIEVTSKNPTSEQFVGFDADGSSLDGQDGKNGNLGEVRVKTNSRGWDVTFTTVNGGKLAVTNDTIMSQQAMKPGIFPPQYYDSSWTVHRNPAYLLYDNTYAGTANVQNLTNPTRKAVQVSVGIGMLEKISGAKYLKGFANNLNAAAYATPLVPASDLDASQTLLENGSTNTSAVSVSFVEVLSTAASSPGLTAAQAAITDSDRKIKVGGRELGTGATSTSTLGFGPTNSPITIPNIPKKDDDYEYFYVNVGLPEANVDYILGNKKGDYSETFTFTLLANF